MSIEDQIRRMQKEADMGAIGTEILESAMFDGGAAVFFTGAVVGTDDVKQIKANLRQLLISVIRTYMVFHADDGKGNHAPAEDVLADMLAYVTRGAARYTYERGVNFTTCIAEAETVLKNKYGLE